MSHQFYVSVPKFHYYKAGQFLETFGPWPKQPDGKPVIELRVRDKCVFVETVHDDKYAKLAGTRVVQWRIYNSGEPFQDVPEHISSTDELVECFGDQKIQVNFWQELTDHDEPMGISSEEIPDNDIWGTCAMNPDEYPKAYTSDIGRRQQIASRATRKYKSLLPGFSLFQNSSTIQKLSSDLKLAETEETSPPLHYIDVPWELSPMVDHKDFRTNYPKKTFSPDGMIRLVLTFQEMCTIEDFCIEVADMHEEISFLKNQQMLEVECCTADGIVSQKKAIAREEKKRHGNEHVYVYDFLNIGEVIKVVIFIPVRNVHFGFQISTRHEIIEPPEAFIRWFHWPCMAKFASSTCWIAKPSEVAAREATLSFKLSEPGYPGKLLCQGHPTQNWLVDQCLMEYSEDGVDWFNHPMGVLTKEKKQVLVDFEVFPEETYLEVPCVATVENLEDAIKFTKDNKRKYFAWFSETYEDEERRLKVYAWSSKKQMGDQGNINSWTDAPGCTSGIRWLSKIDIAKLIRKSELYPKADTVYDEIANAIIDFLFFTGHTSFIVREDACIPFALNDSAIDQRQFIGRAKNLMEAKLLAQKEAKEYFTWYNPLVKPITEVSGMVFGWSRSSKEVESWDRDERAVSGRLWMNPNAPTAISDFCYLEAIDWGTDEVLYWWDKHMPESVEDLPEILQEEGFKGEDLVNLSEKRMKKWGITDPDIRAAMLWVIAKLQPKQAFDLVGSWVWPLQPPIRATYFRLRPLSYVGMPAMRIEVLGVQGEGTPLFSVDPDNVGKSEQVSQHPNVLGEDDQVKTLLKLSNKLFCVDVGRILEMELENMRKRGGIIGQYCNVRCEKQSDQGMGGFLYTFTVANGASEEILDLLKGMGIGVNFGYITMTQIDWALPVFDPNQVIFSSHVDQQKWKAALEQEQFNENGQISTVKKIGKDFYTCALQCNLFQTVSHRSILIDSFVDSVMGGAVITFDYVCLCSVAALIAGGGLATDNVVAVIASMLVSPLMGPILGFTFGTWTSDSKMIITGLVSEAFGLFLCVFWGFIIGFIFIPFRDHYEDLGGFPSGQMKSRGQPEGLAEGFLIAFPSGIGVAVSVMSENTASLVGVAISASLLPPAVNFGIYLAIVLADSEAGDDEAMEGFISFILTIENITLIYVTSLAVLYLKRFVVKSKSERQFWDYIDKRTEQESLEKKIQNERLKTIRHAVTDRTNETEYDFQKAIYQTLAPNAIDSRSSTFNLTYDELKDMNKNPDLRNLFSKGNGSALYPKSSQLYQEKTDYIFSIRKEKTTRALSSRHVNLEDVFGSSQMDLDLSGKVQTSSPPLGSGPQMDVDSSHGRSTGKRSQSVSGYE